MSTYPRKFTYNKPEGFADSTKYILLYHDGSSARETKDGRIADSGDYFSKEYCERMVEEGAWKEIFPEQPKTKYYLHAELGAFGPTLERYYVQIDGQNSKAVNSDGTSEPIAVNFTYVQKFVADGTWKEVDEATAKAALKPAPKARRFQLKSGPFGKYSGNSYHFESDENGKGWWVYDSGHRAPAESYRTLERALKWVEDGDWVEIVGAKAPPVETEAPKVEAIERVFRHRCYRDDTDWKIFWTEGSDAYCPHLGKQTWPDYRAREFVRDGHWVEIAEAPTAPPVLQTKAPECREYLVAYQFADKSGSVLKARLTFDEANKFAAEEVKKLSVGTSTVVYRPVKSFTLVQNAPTVEEKTL